MHAFLNKASKEHVHRTQLDRQSQMQIMTGEVHHQPKEISCVALAMRAVLNQK